MKPTAKWRVKGAKGLLLKKVTVTGRYRQPEGLFSQSENREKPTSRGSKQVLRF